MSLPASKSVARLALLLLACTLATGLGSVRTGFNGRDEYRYAHIAREMTSLERCFVLHNQGQLYLDKPPLYFWMARAAFAFTGGVSPFGARLPLILSTLLTILLIYDIGRRLLNDRAALLGAMAYGLAFRPIWSAHNTKLDPPVVLFIVLALWFWARGFERWESGRRGKWTDTVGMWLAMGLGFLVKGPLALLPLAILIAWRAVCRLWRGTVGLSTPLGVFVLLLALAAWIVPAWLMAGWEGYLGPMVDQEVVGRVVKPPQHIKEGFLGVIYFFAYVWGDFFPAAFFLPGALWMACRERGRDKARDRRLLFLFCWFAFIMVFFTLMRSKRSQYILPAYPAAALLVGWFLDRVLAGTLTLGPRWYRIPMRIVGIVGLIGAGIIWFDLPFIRQEFHLPMSLAIKAAGTAVLALSGILCLSGSFTGHILRGLTGCFALIPALLIAAYTLYFPAAYVDAPFRQFAKRMDLHTRPGQAVLVTKKRKPQLSIWGHYVTFGTREEGGLRLLGFKPDDKISTGKILRAFADHPDPLLMVVSGDNMEEYTEKYPDISLHTVWSGNLPIYSGDGGFHVIANVPDYAKLMRVPHHEPPQ